MNADAERARGVVVNVSDGQFQLTDFGIVPELGPEISELVVPLISGGVAVMCGISAGPVQVRAEAAATEPPLDAGTWEEVAEASFDAPVGQVRVTPLFEDPVQGLPVLTSGPGTYRVRVHATGRNEARNRVVGSTTESYLVQVWPAAPRP